MGVNVMYDIGLHYLFFHCTKSSLYNTQWFESDSTGQLKLKLVLHKTEIKMSCHKFYLYCVRRIIKQI